MPSLSDLPKNTPTRYSDVEVGHIFILLGESQEGLLHNHFYQVTKKNPRMELLTCKIIKCNRDDCDRSSNDPHSEWSMDSIKAWAHRSRWITTEAAKVLYGL